MITPDHERGPLRPDLRKSIADREIPVNLGCGIHCGDSWESCQELVPRAGKESWIEDAKGAAFFSFGACLYPARCDKISLKTTKGGAVMINRHALLPAVIGALLIILALTAGIFVTQYTDKPAVAAEPTSKVIVVPARTPGPTETPTISSLRLYTLGAELGQDGFTAYVGDKAITLKAEIEPKMINLPVYWSFSDPDSANLSVGDDRLSCAFTALKPSGKNELTVKCYGAELVIPVYLWEK